MKALSHIFKELMRADLGRGRDEERRFNSDHEMSTPLLDTQVKKSGNRSRVETEIEGHWQISGI